MLAGCGSGDTTVANTPSATSTGTETAGATPGSTPTDTADGTATTPASPGAAAPPAAAPGDPCAINLAAPAIAKAVSELPRDPRSKQPWNPEPVAGNYSECAELSAVIVQANTNAANRSTRAVLFHRGQYVPQAVPDTYGFTGIVLAQCTPDTVALQHPTGVAGINGIVKFHWNGTGVEIIANTPG